MTTTNGTPVEETSVELKDAMNWAADIVNTAINRSAPGVCWGRPFVLHKSREGWEP